MQTHVWLHIWGSHIVLCVYVCAYVIPHRWGNNDEAKELLLCWRIASGIFMLAADIMLTGSEEDKGGKCGQRQLEKLQRNANYSPASGSCKSLTADNLQWQVASSPVDRKSLQITAKATTMRLTNGSLLHAWLTAAFVAAAGAYRRWNELCIVVALPCLPHYWEFCKLSDKLVCIWDELYTHTHTVLHMRSGMWHAMGRRPTSVHHLWVARETGEDCEKQSA